jgi:hypothetical protein
MQQAWLSGDRRRALRQSLIVSAWLMLATAVLVTLLGGG